MCVYVCVCVCVWVCKSGLVLFAIILMYMKSLSVLPMMASFPVELLTAAMITYFAFSIRVSFTALSFCLPHSPFVWLSC